MDGCVLCTGVSGFLGSHIAFQLLTAGYHVRGSVRSPVKAEKVRTTLRQAGADISRLELIQLDLLEDTGWKQAARGCTSVIHTASPFVLTMPKDPSDLIRPAVEGTRRAMTAALESGVDRIVVTSSVAAIVHGHDNYERVLTGADWTNLKGPRLTAYIRSKTLAEQAAWSLAEEAGRRQNLAVINPGGILGPLLDDDPGTTGALVVRMLQGGMPAAPAVRLGWVDVRDVAEAHIAAMKSSGAGGRRHIVSGETLSLMQIAEVLGAGIPEYRKRMPRFEMPGWVIPIIAAFDRSLRDIAPETGPIKRTDPTAAEALLGRSLRPASEAVLATGHSAIEKGLI